MTGKTSVKRLTSLLLVEERLMEADFFAGRLVRAKPNSVGYFLSAFLSAARSVTFLLQKELAHVPGFRQWRDAQRLALGADPAARFFLELRNFSQKEGRVSLVGVRTGYGRSSKWTFRFVGVQTSVPAELWEVDACHACFEHVAKLARVVLACMTVFPFQTCPGVALSPAGIQALGLDALEMFDMLHLPFVEGHDDLAWCVLRGQVDGVDVSVLRKLASGRHRRPRRQPSTASDKLSAEVLSSLEGQLRGPVASLDLSQMAFGLLVGKGPPDTKDPKR